MQILYVRAVPTLDAPVHIKVSKLFWVIAAIRPIMLKRGGDFLYLDIAKHVPHAVGIHAMLSKKSCDNDDEGNYKSDRGGDHARCTNSSHIVTDVQADENAEA